MKLIRYVLYYDVDLVFFMYIFVFFIKSVFIWVNIVIQIYGNCIEFFEIFEIYVGNEYNILVIYNE